MTSKIKIILLALVVLSGFLPDQAFSQATTAGSLAGTVTDPSGSVIPHATLTLTQPATGSHAVQTANSEGAFIFPSLQVGTYRLTVAASGFADAVYESVPVSVGRSSNLNVSMTIVSAKIFPPARSFAASIPGGDTQFV
jgi:hypothetical protein